MAEFRRLRTQAERDADGTTWRAAADSRPGYATYPTTRPGSPSWWRHDGPSTGQQFADGLADIAPYIPPPVSDHDRCARWCGFCHLNNGNPEQPAEQPPADRSWIEMETSPRRRWWHRYTRRTV